MVDRLRVRVPLPVALQRFADEMDDAGADLIIAALILNSRLRGPGLRDVLTSLADSARAELDMRQRRQRRAQEHPAQRPDRDRRDRRVRGRSRGVQPHVRRALRHAVRPGRAGRGPRVLRRRASAGCAGSRGSRPRPGSCTSGPPRRCADDHPGARDAGRGHGRARPGPAGLDVRARLGHRRGRAGPDRRRAPAGPPPGQPDRGPPAQRGVGADAPGRLGAARRAPGARGEPAAVGARRPGDDRPVRRDLLGPVPARGVPRAVPSLPGARADGAGRGDQPRRTRCGSPSSAPRSAR